MSSASARRGLVIFIGIMLLTRIINAAWLSPVQDEAYYFYWSRFLDAGYFDHPPLVSWLASPGQWLPGSTLLARLGTILLSLLSLPVILSFMKRLGLKGKEPLFSAVLLSVGSLAAILQGYITTPDIPMMFCWILGLHEAAVALDDKPKRWLSAGLFTGLGILGKYTMLLIGPVFLIALLVKPRKLLQPWPYLGALVCILTLLPHIIWLGNHEWITLRFQFGRGLQSIYSLPMTSPSDLPVAKAATANGIETQLARYFKLPEDEISLPRPKPTGWVKYSQNVGNYCSGQLSLWGLLLGPLLLAFLRRRPMKTTWAKPELMALAWAACWVPLILFGLLSPWQQIEANWPAMYMIGAAAILAQTLKISSRSLYWAAGGNLGLSLVLTLHSHWPLLRKKPHQDRILKETHGYSELTQYLQTLAGPILTDTYQNASQIAFFAPNLKIQQWPGMARTSELLRNPAMNPWRWDELKQHGTFYILSDNPVPAAIPGANIKELSEILDCLDKGIQITLAKPAQDPYKRPCAQRIHRWSLAFYSVLP